MPERTNVIPGYTRFRTLYIRPCPNSRAGGNSRTFGNAGAHCHQSSPAYSGAYRHGNATACVYSFADTGACSHSDTSAYRHPGAYA